MLADLSVVPYVGTWVETIYSNKQANSFNVVPYVGTWVETVLKAN